MKSWARGSGFSIACAVMMTLALALAGCSDEPAATPSPQPVRPPPPEPEEYADIDGEPAEDAEEEIEERAPEYVYSPIGKRDPFRSPFQDLVAMERQGRGGQERLTALQRWDLDQLNVRAIISATANPMAMVVDPEGHGHVVRRGVLIGRNWGRVTAIRRECLVITEQMRDATGTPMAVQQERCLPKDEREASFEAQIGQQIQ